MQNYFILAITVCGIYLVSEFAMKKFSKNKVPNDNMKQNTVRTLLVVFVSVVGSLIAFDKLGVMRLAPLKTVNVTPAFTNAPEF